MIQDNRSIEVSIAAHYVPQRVRYLARALDAINQWQQTDIAIAIVTNDLALADDPALSAVMNELNNSGRKVTFDKTHGLEHPWHLTWWHKQRLRQWAEQAGDGDLFCYIEDDIAVPRAAIDYFMQYLDAAKQRGVIPGFLRYEIDADNRTISTDFRTHQSIADDDIISLSGTSFVPLEYPYWAGFVLDKKLADEYLRSPWSQIDSANAQPQSHGHTCRVQSAWALTYHNVLPTMPSRLVAPVDADLQPLEQCCVWHTPNNYSATRSYGFGTIALGSVFMRAGLRAKIANLRRALAQQGHRIMRKLGGIFRS